MAEIKRPKSLKTCAYCGTINTPLNLILQDFIYETLTTGHIYNGKIWKYECPICNERFTTTESDEISMSNLKRTEI